MSWSIYRLPKGAATGIQGVPQHAWQQAQQDAFADAVAAANAKGVQVDLNASALIGAVQGVEGTTAVVFSTADTKGQQVMISTDVITGFAPWWVA